MERTHTIVKRHETPDDWRQLELAMSTLTTDQLKAITDRLGVTPDDPDQLTPQDYVNVMDRACWDEVAGAYERVTGERWPS